MKFKIIFKLRFTKNTKYFTVPRSMVHLMYPQKLMFHGHILEAEKINEALNYIYHYKHTGF